MRNLVDELNRCLPAAAHVQLGSLLQDLITKHNAAGSMTTVQLSAVLSPAAVAANTTAEQVFPVPGVLVGDFVDVNKPTAQPGIGIVGIRVAAAGQVGITFNNHTAAPIVPTANETYLFGIIRSPATSLAVTDLVTRGQTAA